MTLNCPHCGGHGEAIVPLGYEQTPATYGARIICEGCGHAFVWWPDGLVPFGGPVPEPIRRAVERMRREGLN